MPAAEKSPTPKYTLEPKSLSTKCFALQEPRDNTGHDLLYEFFFCTIPNKKINYDVNIRVVVLARGMGKSQVTLMTTCRGPDGPFTRKKRIIVIEGFPKANASSSRHK